MSLQQLFYPRGVAVIGSAGEGKIGYYMVRQLLAGGFRAVYAVNPKAQGVGEVVGYPSVAAIDAPVDLAVIASPAATVAGVLEDCGQAGVKAAIIVTSGFSEMGNAAGEEELKRIASKHGIRVVGPNCAGIINTRHHLTPTLETLPPAGDTALITQSGALGGAVLSWAEEQGLGFSKFVSYGNRMDIGEAELLRYLAHDPETKAVALYLESVADGRDFMPALVECTRQKPVVVLKAGRSQAGQRATLSHTGSMAGADAVYDAALAECGAIRVHTVEEMFDLCKGFTHLPPVTGRRIAIVTNSGGPGVMAADRAEEIGLTLPEPSERIKARLREFLPPHCSLRNPLDLTVEGTEAGYRETLLAALLPGPDGPEYDAALALDVGTAYLDSVPLARGIASAAERTGCPIVVNFMAGKPVAMAIRYMADRGMPNFAIGERAVAVLGHMAKYHEWLQTHKSAKPRPDEVSTAPEAALRLAPVLEPEAMAWLRANGIPTPEFRVARGPEEAVQKAREVGYPVVMKVVSADILHKSDSGGVVLNIDGDEAARSGFVRVQKAAAGKDFQGAIIYPMVKGAQEVILGASRDVQFGPVVVFGLGGIYTEILRDISLRVAPIDRIEAENMIHSIRTVGLLQGARGQKPCDLDALADVLVKFSQLPFRYPQIKEIDLNPVFLLPKGLVVGDVRIIQD